MADIGSLLSSLPDRPLPVDVVTGLEEHEGIAVSEPVLTERTREGPVCTRIALVTERTGVVLEYAPAEGWRVIERVDGEGRSTKELALALSVESIKDGMEPGDEPSGLS